MMRGGATYNGGRALPSYMSRPSGPHSYGYTQIQGRFNKNWRNNQFRTVALVRVMSPYDLNILWK